MAADVSHTPPPMHKRDGLAVRRIVERGEAGAEQLAEEVEHLVVARVDQRAEARQLDGRAVGHLRRGGHVMHQHFERPVQRVAARPPTHP